MPKPRGTYCWCAREVVGIEQREILETKEPRKYPIEFAGPWRDSDTFEIALPLVTKWMICPRR